jgi:hypothetical protein
MPNGQEASGALETTGMRTSPLERLKQAQDWLDVRIKLAGYKCRNPVSLILLFVVFIAVLFVRKRPMSKKDMTYFMGDDRLQSGLSMFLQNLDREVQS